MTNLTLACPELAEDLGYRTRFDTSCKQSVQLLRASRNGYQFASSLVHLGSRRKPHRHKLRGFSEELRRLLLGNSLDLLQRFPRPVRLSAVARRDPRILTYVYAIDSTVL